jgi:hypothetical protein
MRRWDHCVGDGLLRGMTTRASGVTDEWADSSYVETPCETRDAGKRAKAHRGEIFNPR